MAFRIGVSKSMRALALSGDGVCLLVNLWAKGWSVAIEGAIEGARVGDVLSLNVSVGSKGSTKISGVSVDRKGLTKIPGSGGA
jgi:hypothetical protein